jgi:hypothetical protein
MPAAAIEPRVERYRIVAASEAKKEDVRRNDEEGSVVPDCRCARAAMVWDGK